MLPYAKQASETKALLAKRKSPEDGEDPKSKKGLGNFLKEAK
jgi:hypothetical protein